MDPNFQDTKPDPIDPEDKLAVPDFSPSQGNGEPGSPSEIQEPVERQKEAPETATSSTDIPADFTEVLRKFESDVESFRSRRDDDDTEPYVPTNFGEQQPDVPRGFFQSPIDDTGVQGFLPFQIVIGNKVSVYPGLIRCYKVNNAGLVDTLPFADGVSVDPVEPVELFHITTPSSSEVVMVSLRIRVGYYSSTYKIDRIEYQLDLDTVPPVSLFPDFYFTIGTFRRDPEFVTNYIKTNVEFFQCGYSSALSAVASL